MPKRRAICKSSRALFSAFARIVISCLFGTGCGCGKIFVANNLFCIAMVHGIYIFYSILFITSVAFCSLCAILRTSCVIVRNIICKTMPERRAVCKSFRSFLAARTRIIIGCFFGAGCVSRFVFVRYNLFVERMNMSVVRASG